MSSSHFSRSADGHLYELIINYVDSGSGPFPEYVPGSWELLRDGLPVMDHDEAHRLRREHFGKVASR